MAENFEYLFQYLEKENIKLDKSEFLFQIQSHPDYPSLLAVADTLSFFKIENGAISVSISELELLPNRFITHLTDYHNAQFYLIEKKDNRYFYIKDKKNIEISLSSLEKSWDEIVFLIEKTEAETTPTKTDLSAVLPILSLGLFIAAIFAFEENWKNNFFFIFPLLGVLFSIAALKDLFGTKNEMLNKFCNISVSTSCTTIVDSEKWKVFKYLNFSDLSIVFFGAQFLGLFLFTIFGQVSVFLSIQKVLLLFSLPILVASLYFQKFV